MKVRLSLIIASLSMAILTSCGHDDAPKDTSKSNGTILMLLGSKIPYWDQIYRGAKEVGDQENYKIMTVYRDADTVNTTVLKTLSGISDIPNLKGIIMMPSDKAIENMIVLTGTKVPIVVVDQKLHENSPLQTTVRTTVVADNDKIGKEIGEQIKENKILTLCYAIGGSYDRSMAIQRSLGKNRVDVLIVNDANEAKNSIENYMSQHQGENFAVAFATGSFVNKETMALLKGKSVYAVDMNEPIQEGIRNGDIIFTAIPNTFEMGAMAFRSVISKTPSFSVQIVSVVYANMSNINTGDIQAFTE
ncbi:substrate-binding domain-containing protein [uncultured Fibrobacter sp.]|uniref:sugar ABC transporter substrate-binding protein n=1 Tax=uncultured Fibrobacter sp. TaxID=261512 RepID=UPI0026281F76|nr:substrate-binding domain-containing protein [uncultured Fibrobacter sp.]